MALNFADRFLTIVVTATLTSAAWIVVGSMTVERLSPIGDLAAEESAVAAPKGARSPPETAVLAVTDDDLIIPIENVRAGQLVDSYADDRGDGERPHEAIDIIAPAGTLVVAAAPGTVESLFRSGDGGNTIYIRSDDRRTIQYYAHLQRYAPNLEEGQRVRRGERLGFVGSTGNADPAAPHLHFAILRTRPDANWWDDATPLNPYPLLGGK